MNGLELSKQYFWEVGMPMLETEYADCLPRIAAGLAGEGSECLGYDDEISRDHDFGPGFCLWLTEEDFRKIGARLQASYEALPKEFRGFPARNTSARGNGRVGVMEISSFYRRFIGKEQPPASLMRWLYLPEEKLAAAVNGEVFTDPLGEFSAIREALAAYYPEDVRVKKIAARAAVMAQSGQYNYARCMRRGESVAAGLALGEFLRSAMSMIYLLNRQYAPYYKWMFRGLEQGLERGPEREPRGEKSLRLRGALPLLKELSMLGGQEAAWREPHPAGWNPYVNKWDRKVELIEEICRMTIEELKVQGLTDSRDDFLEAHTWEIMKRIQDPELRRCHVLEG